MRTAILLIICLLAIGGVYAQAPNAGDGISDGSGFDGPMIYGKNDADSPGPAPNSGDGIPDGSGF